MMAERDHVHVGFGRHDEEVVCVRTSDLLALLGEFGLPPWRGGGGEALGDDVDCAALAEAMLERLEGIVLARR